MNVLEGNMLKGRLYAVAIVSFVALLGIRVLAEEGAFEYPCYLIDAFDADDSCWEGMDVDGTYRGPVRVVPEKWLVGAPPSTKSGVTLPPDHWAEVQFRGRIVDGPGDDILLIELGPVSEQALVFITDGADQEYLLGIATSGSIGSGVDPTEIGFDIADFELPFAPRAIRLLGLDTGGEAPGFDIASIRARIATDCGQPACCPVPVDGAENVLTDAVLSWSPGQSAESHVVYLGKSRAGVAADAVPVTDPPQPQDANTFDPCDLELGTTYYWRVDEVNDSQVRPGPIWSFKTTDHLVVDDFDQYNLRTPGDPNNVNFAGTWSGASVNLWWEFTHECSKQAMAFNYRYYHYSVYSEAVHTFRPTQDWTAAGEKVLELFFRGQPTNIIGQMYLVLDDEDSETIIAYPGDANDLRKDTWQPWRIVLGELNDPNLDLSCVTSIALGFCAEAGKPNAEGYGTVYFDDIRLYSSLCLPENRPEGDFNGDCVVNSVDLGEMAARWLDRGYNLYPVAPPNAPILWYEFEGNADDSAGAADGRALGHPTYVQGVYGQAIRFDGGGDAVDVVGTPGVFAKAAKGITIVFWQYGADSGHTNDTVCCSDFDYGSTDPAIAIHLGCWRQPGRYIWDCGGPWSFANRLSGNHRYASEWLGRWNHWAFTKDTRTGAMQIFLNGVLYASRTGADAPIAGVHSFQIGSGSYGGYDGLIDDFRIYGYALSQAEVAYVATNGTGVFDQPLMIAPDLNVDDRIDFSDFAMLADDWLKNHLWP
jgi:hypothetical protein